MEGELTHSEPTYNIITHCRGQALPLPPLLPLSWKFVESGKYVEIRSVGW